MSERPIAKRSLFKRMVIMLLGVGVLFFLVFGFGTFKNIMIAKFLKTLSNPTQTVATTKAVTSPWQSQLHAVGTLRAVNGANLSAEVSGIVDKIGFQSGQDVKAGTVLLTLRPNNDQATLDQLQATAELNRVTYQRDVRQLAAKAVSQQAVDQDKATLASALAQVEGQKALMAEKIVKAPFDGRLGIRQVDIGQYLTAGTTIVTLQQLDPIFADFYLPQQALGQISVGQEADITLDGFPGKSFAGKITAISSAVDTSSRNIQVRATLANPGLVLRPGMFANVSINVGAPEDHVTLPQTAITYNPYGDTVYEVVTDGGKSSAKQVFVSVGATRGDQVAVLKGVAAGDVVVTAGGLKLHNGAPVAINNSIEPANNPNPNPPNE